MRVLHVCAYYAPAYVYGGPVRSIHALCKAQQAHGIDVEVFTTNAAGHRRLAAAPQGSIFDGIRVRYFELSAPARLLGAADLAAAVSREVDRIDVVHVHGLFNRTVWDAVGRLNAAGKPYVLSPRGMLEAPALAHHRWRKRLTWHFKDRAVVAGARVLHATSVFELDTLRREHDGIAVVHVPNPVSVPPVQRAEAQHWRASLGIAGAAPLVLSLGRLHRIKRLDLVAAAFLQLRRDVPEAHLVIAGPDEQGLRQEIEAQLEAVKPYVHWTGAVDGARKAMLLAEANVLVQCSDSESFGMSVAEALASGTPVVVTRTCPWQDVEESGCGFWVDQSPEAIAKGLRDVVTNPQLALEQGRAGRHLVIERMSPPRIAATWHVIYHKAASLNPAAA
jgi:glycosyltransferase involved in cell wall biosynthesis